MLLIDNRPVYTDYIRIENLAQYLTTPPQLHPDSPQYNVFWSKETKRCIEGVWGEMFGGFRYMPGNLYYYGNYTLIQQTDKNKVTKYLKPRIDDIEWEFAYMSLEAKGFSGWVNDEWYTSFNLVKELNDAGVTTPTDYILTNYPEVVAPDGNLKRYIEPRENIRKLHTAPMGRPYYHNETQNVGILGCLGKDVSVRMFNGDIKLSQDIEVGDLIMGPDSKPREVTELIRGEHMIYKVSTRYGEDYNASYNHVLYLNYHDKHKGLIRKELTIGQFLDIPEEDRKKYYSALMAPCIHYPTKDLYIDPYFVGLWLGDGFKREKLIVVSEDDPEILEWLINYANSEERFSYTITSYTGNMGTKSLNRFRLIDNTLLRKNNWWSTTFRNNKHIPFEYATGDEEQRLKLLAGFIDSDGSCDGKRFTITNVDLSLLQQIQNVARSLGFRSVIHKPSRSGITNSLKYNLRITGDISKIPTLVKRKQAENSTLKQGSNKNDISVVPIGRQPFYGFEVTGDRLYCLADYSITHNSRGGGKALSINTLVQIPDGQTEIKNIKIGDTVFDRQGLPTKVTGVFPQGVVPMYRITFRSGRQIECCENHLWEVSKWNSTNLTVLDTKTMFTDFKGIRAKDFKYKIRNNNLVEYTTKPYDIDTYLLGLILGDGGAYEYKYKHTHKQVKITANKIDVPHYTSYLDTINVPYRVLNKKGTDNYSIIFNTDLFNKLKNLDLVNCKAHSKFIPKEYLYGDSTQRLKLLQGILDTDGYVNVRQGTNNTINFASVSKQLIHDVVYLCRSLGIACKQPKHYNNKYQGYWETTLYTNNADVFSLDRKKSLITNKTTNRQLSNHLWDVVYNIEPLQEAEAICITVDNDEHLFLIEDFVVTHNSFYTALAEIEHGLIFDGATEYNEDFIRNLITAEYCIGSANSDKSSELASKIDASIRAKSAPDLGRQFGVWGQEGDDDFTPCPFYKDMTGSFATNNKKNPYRHEYKVELGGRWVPKGTSTKMYHVNYSSKKGDGAQAASGGRYKISVEEEWGLEENAIDVHTSNESTVAREGVFFGVQWKMGTSGNIEYIQSTKKMFLNPRDYRIVSYKNHHGTDGQDGYTGFFLPFYMVLRQFKDNNGNTDYEAAVKHVNKIRKTASESSDPKVLRDERMNRPCFVDEMWVTDKTYYLPYEEAAVRERELMAFGKGKQLENTVKLIWDAGSNRGVRYEIDHDAEPYREFPVDFSKKKDPSGCVVIYDFPPEGDIPHDMFMFVGLDPYVEEDIDRGGSIGAAFIIANPKYIPQGIKGNCIVATYIGKPINGLNEYYENLLKLMTFYNCGPQSLWFEKNRGEACREFFIRKNRIDLLCLTPQFIVGSNVYQKKSLSFGYLIGNRVSKINQLKVLNDWLLEETELADGKKKNIQRIPCIFTIRQIMQYDIDGNFDAVDGLRGAVMGVREYENKMTSERRIQHENSGRFNSLINNPKIFKNARTKRLYEANRS